MTISTCVPGGWDPNVLLPCDYRCRNVEYKCMSDRIPTDKVWNFGCMEPPPHSTCECKGGMRSIVIGYSGSLAEASQVTTNSGTPRVFPEGDRVYFELVAAGEKLEKDLMLTDGGQRGGAQFHTSCSQDILGKTVNRFTPMKYTDSNDELTTIEYCPDQVYRGSSGSGKGSSQTSRRLSSSGKGSSGKGSSSSSGVRTYSGTRYVVFIPDDRPWCSCRSHGGTPTRALKKRGGPLQWLHEN